MTLGDKKYSRRVRHYREGYMSVSVYKNVFEFGEIFDIVIHRKIRGEDGKNIYKRGANLKPTDLPILCKLLDEARRYVEAEIAE